MVQQKDTYTTLYIIGNGFDLHHNLDTWYSSFGLFLKKYHNDIYDVFTDYYGFEDLSENNKENFNDYLWAQFEDSLALMNAELLLENHLEYLPNYASDDFRDRDRYDLSVSIEEVVDKATLKMRIAFEEFIDNVSYPGLSTENLLPIEKKALFLTFNYTDTLERYYNIERESIKYIHNKSGEDNGLVLGHGIDPQEFVKQEEEPPEDPEEYELWYESRSECDYSIERGKDEVLLYFQKSFKPTEDIIAQNIDFFNKLNLIKKIYVLGHSLSEVDIPYFQEIKKHLEGKQQWYVSYHKHEERYKKIKTLSSLGIDIEEISLIKITELKNN